MRIQKTVFACGWCVSPAFMLAEAKNGGDEGGGIGRMVAEL